MSWEKIGSSPRESRSSGKLRRICWRLFFSRLTLSPQDNCRLLIFSSASVFKVFQCCSKLVMMLSECQTAWIYMRRRVTRRLSRIKAVSIWQGNIKRLLSFPYGCSPWRANSRPCLFLSVAIIINEGNSKVLISGLLFLKLQNWSFYQFHFLKVQTSV